MKAVYLNICWKEICKMTRQEILNLLRIYKKENSHKYGITNIGLIGSYAKDTANDYSDIDIVIETSEPDPFKIVHIKEDLENLFQKSVDIIRKRESINPLLKKQIAEHARYV